jgi:hypothetical protein
MIWSWLTGSRLGRAMSGAVVAASLLLGLIAQQRRDARKDALRDAREKDRDNADSIRDRLSRADNSLHKYRDRGFRD